MRNLTIRSLEEETEAFASNTSTVKSVCFWLTAEEIFLDSWSIENIEGKARYKKEKSQEKNANRLFACFVLSWKAFFFLP